MLIKGMRVIVSGGLTMMLLAGTVFAQDKSTVFEPVATGGAAQVRVVSVSMDDRMRFQPDRIEVQQGETVRIDVTNVGRLEHELVLGNLAALRAHAEEMRSGSRGMHHHGGNHEGNAVTVKPGATGGLTGTFARAGTLDFACLLPGHFEAGMKGKVIVH